MAGRASRAPPDLLVVGTPIGEPGRPDPARRRCTAHRRPGRGRRHAAGRAAPRPRRARTPTHVLQRAQRRSPGFLAAGAAGRRRNAGADHRRGHARRLGPRSGARCRCARGRRRNGGRARADGGHRGRRAVRVEAPGFVFGGFLPSRPASARAGRSIACWTPPPRPTCRWCCTRRRTGWRRCCGSGRAGARARSVPLASSPSATRRCWSGRRRGRSRLGSPRGEFTVVVSGLRHRRRRRATWRCGALVQAGRREGLSDRTLVALLRAIGLSRRDAYRSVEAHRRRKRPGKPAVTTLLASCARPPRPACRCGPRAGQEDQSHEQGAAGRTPDP